MKKICIAFVVFYIASIGIASAGGIDSLYISGDSQGIVGGNITIYVNATNVDDISNFKINLLYDPNILSTGNNKVKAGNLINGSNMLQCLVDNSAGKITLSTISLSNGSGTIAKIKFDIKSTGTSPLDISVVSIKDKENNETHVDNIVNSTFEGIDTGQQAKNFTFTVDKQSANVDVGADAIYTLTLENTGNATDTYSLTIDNPDNSNVSLSQDSITLNSSDTDSIDMIVNSSIAGTYTVSVTATPESDSTKAQTITTTTNIGSVAPVGGFTFTADRSYIIVGPSGIASFNLTIKNNGNLSDSYSLTIDNPDNATVNLSSKNLSVSAGKSKNVTMKINSPIIGRYIVNVTATPSSDPSQAQTITTITDVAIAKILGFNVSNGSRGGYVKADVTIGNFDNQTHWFAVIVSGTDQNGNPIVGTGTVRLSADRAIKVPVLAAVPSSIAAGRYKLYAGLFLFDNETINSQELIGNIAGPRTTTIS